MLPCRMDSCPQGSHSRESLAFMGVPVHKTPVQGRSAGPWEYGDGIVGSTLQWVYTGVGACPATIVISLMTFSDRKPYVGKWVVSY